MKKFFKLKQKGLTEINVLLFIFSSFIAFISTSMLSTQTTSRDVTRLKNLEAINYAMANYYARYAEEPILYSDITSSNEKIENSTKIFIGSGKKYDQIDLTADFTATKLNIPFCTEKSRDKTIIFYQTNSSLVYCKEDGGNIELRYK